MQLLSLNLLEDKLKPSVVLQLSSLVYDYFKERHPDVLGADVSVVNAKVMVEKLLELNNYIYYVADLNHNILGFVTMSINDQFGMVSPHLVIDYMYIKPEFRKSCVTALLFGVIGHVANTMEMDVIGTTFIESSNIRNATIVEGLETAVTYLYRRDKFNKRYKKYLGRYL